MPVCHIWGRMCWTPSLDISDSFGIVNSYSRFSFRRREKEAGEPSFSLLRLLLPDNSPHGSSSRPALTMSHTVMCDTKYVAGNVPSAQKTSCGGIQPGGLNLSITERQYVPIPLEIYGLLGSFFLLLLRIRGLHNKFFFLSLSYLALTSAHQDADFREWVKRKESRGRPTCTSSRQQHRQKGFTKLWLVPNFPWSLNLLLKNLRLEWVPKCFRFICRWTLPVWR